MYTYEISYVSCIMYLCTIELLTMPIQAMYTKLSSKVQLLLVKMSKSYVTLMSDPTHGHGVLFT